jgi:hypothetical protein
MLRNQELRTFPLGTWYTMRHYCPAETCQQDRASRSLSQIKKTFRLHKGYTGRSPLQRMFLLGTRSMSEISQS